MTKEINEARRGNVKNLEELHEVLSEFRGQLDEVLGAIEARKQSTALRLASKPSPD